MRNSITFNSTHTVLSPRAYCPRCELLLLVIVVDMIEYPKRQMLVYVAHALELEHRLSDLEISPLAFTTAEPKDPDLKLQQYLQLLETSP